MKHKILILTVIITGLLFINLTPVLVQAAGEAEGTMLDRLDKVGNEFSEADKPDLPQTLGGIIQVLLSVLGVMFMAYIIFAGWRWLTAAGNEEAISKAKNTISGAAVGLIIVLAAYLITATLIKQLTDITGYKGDATVEVTQ